MLFTDFFFYWTGKQTHEFEFLVQSNGKIYPIDVKKKNGNLGSLEEFRTINGKCTAIKEIHTIKYYYSCIRCSNNKTRMKFNNLKESFIVFICVDAPFGQKLPKEKAVPLARNGLFV